MNRFLLIRFALLLGLNSLETVDRIWLEGEDAVDPEMTRDPWYDQVNRHEYSGGDFDRHFDDEFSTDSVIDLVGFRIRLTPGERGRAKGVVEITPRNQKCSPLHPRKPSRKFSKWSMRHFTAN